MNFKPASQEEHPTWIKKESSPLLQGPSGHNYPKIINIKHSNNWPSLPSFFPCQPCFYQNIPKDIPSEMRDIVIMAYYIWIGYSLTLIFNIFGTLTYFISSDSLESGFTFGFSILLLGLLPVISFVTWYRSLYKACRLDNSSQYFLFFILMYTQIVIIGIQGMGFSWLGSCGWFNSLSVLASDKTAGVTMIFISILFTGLFVLHIILMLKVHQRYRVTGYVSNVRELTDDFRRNSEQEMLREIASFSVKNGATDVLNEINRK